MEKLRDGTGRKLLKKTKVANRSKPYLLTSQQVTRSGDVSINEPHIDQVAKANSPLLQSLNKGQLPEECLSLQPLVNCNKLSIFKVQQSNQGELEGEVGGGTLLEGDSPPALTGTATVEDRFQDILTQDGTVSVTRVVREKPQSQVPDFITSETM